MKIQDLRKLSEKDRQKKLDEMQALVSNHRIERVTGDVKNYKVVRNTRRDIARIRTLMNEAKKQPTTSSTEEKAK